MDRRFRKTVSGAKLAQPDSRLIELMRTFLIALSVPLTLLALVAFLYGLAFGSNLWKAEDPVVTVAWLLIVMSPLLYRALFIWADGSNRRTVALFMVALAASAFIAVAVILL